MDSFLYKIKTPHGLSTKANWDLILRVKTNFALVMSVGGHMIRMAKIPNFAPLAGTILGWEVDEIQATATWRRDRRVNVEKYPLVQDRELGVWTAPSGDKVAWFKDQDGNILSVTQNH